MTVLALPIATGADATGVPVAGGVTVGDGSGGVGCSFAGSAVAVLVTVAGEQPFCSTSIGTMTCGSSGEKWGASSRTCRYKHNYSVNMGDVEIGLT